MRPPLPALLACLALLAGCGEEQKPAPDVFAVEPPQGAKRTEFRRAGISVDRPRNWKLRRRDAPGVFELLSGEALVSGWAYPRDEQLPEPGPALDAAAARLRDAVKERDPGFRVLDMRTTSVAGAPAIELVGRQVISKRVLRTRSVHVFEGGAEYVFEALAPPRLFRRANRVLEQVLSSAELTGQVAEEDG